MGRWFSSKGITLKVRGQEEGIDERPSRADGTGGGYYAASKVFAKRSRCLIKVKLQRTLGGRRCHHRKGLDKQVAEKKGLKELGKGAESLAEGKAGGGSSLNLGP